MRSTEGTTDGPRNGRKRMFLQQTSDRGVLLEKFIDSLTAQSEDYPRKRVKQPLWGAVHAVGAHLAVKHPSEQYFFDAVGKPDYNIYELPFEDILDVLAEFEVVIKTAEFPNVDNQLLQYEAFDHELNEKIVPRRAEETKFFAISDYGDGQTVYCVTINDPQQVTDGSITSNDVTVDTVDWNEFPVVCGNAVSIYTVDSTMIPDGLFKRIRESNNSK